MTAQQRTKASVDLSLTYIQNYYADWRLAKVLTLQKLLSDKYDFYKDFVGEIKHYQDPTGDATIAQEIKNGLYFDAISQCIQYVEDLFALINASAKPDYFIKRIINYDAGVVVNLIKSFNAKLSRKRIAEAFHFPDDLPFTNSEDRNRYEMQADFLNELVNEVTSFYVDYEYFHNQYKHGLGVALRPFGHVYHSDQVAAEKAGSLRPYLAVYDSRSMEVAAKKGTLKSADGIMMLGFTDNVRPHIGELSKEGNFIRLVHPKDKDLSMEMLTQTAYKIRTCVKTFLSNYALKISPEPDQLKFHLPLDYATCDSLIVSYRMLEE